MNWFRSKQDELLDEAIAELRNEQPDAKTLAVSAERVWQRLQDGAGEALLAGAAEPIRGCDDIRALLPAFYGEELSPARALIVEDHLRECVSCRSYAHGRATAAGGNVNWRMEPIARGFQWNLASLSFAVASILLVAVVWGGVRYYLTSLPGSRAEVASIQGQAYRVTASGVRTLSPGDQIADGEFVRTAAGSRAILRLYDGSHVEMNQRAQLSVNANRRNATIHLDQGIIIVQAAKRHTGHLYVSAPDCNVAVTGTMFSVNSGIKGSRVAVIQGEVHVEHEGKESILHSGDIMATTPSVGVVPVQDEISWSSNRDEELALLKEIGELKNKLQSIPMPPPRYQSNILPLLPANTVVYVGIPNLGDALAQANQIFQQQLAQSPVLQDWWNKNANANQHPTPAELIDEIRTLSQYLGDEVVITVTARSGSFDESPVLLAEIRQPGLKDFLQNHVAETLHQHQGAPDFKLVDPQQLASLEPRTGGMIMLVRSNMLVVGCDTASVQRMNAQLETRAGLFADTDFGKRILNVYSQGAETLVAADMGQILSELHKNSAATLQNSGFGDVKYLIATRSQSSPQPDNRITLEFSGERRGIASWLAAPAPIGSLDYVSASAGMAVSFLSKQPANMLDDFFSTVNPASADLSQELAKADSELGIDIRNDLAGALGGDMTIALDGPVLPTPSWKAIVEVNSPGSLQLAIQKLVQDAAVEAAKSNRPSPTLTQQQRAGLTFYTVHAAGLGISGEVDYVFADGYVLFAPSRALLVAALQTHANGTSLAHSASFRALLPNDNQANFSGMLYQNLGPVLQPVASQLNSDQLAFFQQLAGDSKPSVMCAYGQSDRIEVASSGQLFDLNPGALTLLHLLGVSEGHGTSHHAQP
jgi:FecR protein/Putative zinc-finger